MDTDCVTFEGGGAWGSAEVECVDSGGVDSGHSPGPGGRAVEGTAGCATAPAAPGLWLAVLAAWWVRRWT
jgi:hypothetical protein